MATLALAAAGSAIGGALIPAGFLGLSGAAIGQMAGTMLGNYLFAPDVPNTEGPRMDNLETGIAAEGAPIPITYGDGRVQGQFIVADELTEHKKTTSVGGKGGPSATHTEYTYTCTFAVCFGEVQPGAAGLRRVWANKKLIEDYRTVADSSVNGQRIEFYDGTQTEADPTLEALIGVGNVPAYKGLAYGVYLDRLLTDYGNRLPATEAEVCGDFVGTVPHTKVVLSSLPGGSMGGQVYAPRTGTLFFAFAENLAHTQDAILVELEPITQEIIRTIELGASNDVNLLAMGKYGRVGTGELLAVNARGGVGLRVYQTEPWRQVGSDASLIYQLFAETKYHFLAKTFSGVRVYDKLFLNSSDIAAPVGYTIQESAVGIDDDTFLVALDGGSFGKLQLSIAGTWSWTVQDNPSSLISGGETGAITDDNGLHWFALYDASSNSYLVSTNGNGVIQDELDVVTLGHGYGYTSSAGEPVIQYDSQTRSIYFHAGGQVGQFNVDSKTLDVYNDSTDGSWSYYHYDSNTVWTGSSDDAGEAVTYRVRLGVVEPNQIDAADVIEDICDRVGITALDVSDIADTIDGYQIAGQMAGAEAIMPLLRSIHAYPVESEWLLFFKSLGAASVATIDADHLGQREYGSDPIPPLVISDPDSNALPRKLQVHYISTDNGLQAGMQEAENYAGASKQVVSVRLPRVMSDADAAVLAWQLLQLASEQTGYKFSLPKSYGNLDAGDAVTMPTAQGNRRVLISKIDRGYNGILECEGVSDSPENLNAVAVAAGSGVRDVVIPSSGFPRVVVIDGPLLRDADLDHPGPYLAPFTYGSGFPGVVMYASADGQTYTEFGSVISQPAVGVCETVPTSGIDFEDWDSTNTLRITLRTGDTLSSTTEANVLAGANAIAWGAEGRWEIIQFKTATLISTGVYDLSDLLRGRRGTDWAMDLHEENDRMVLLSESTMTRHSVPNGAIDTDRYYKAVIMGGQIENAVERDMTISKAALMPYAPIDIDSTMSGKDINITWQPRTRKGGLYGGGNNLTDGVAGSMVESYERYEIDIIEPGTETVLRTITASTPSCTYLEADQIADGIDADHLPHVTVDIYQISAVVDRGYARRGTVAEKNWPDLVKQAYDLGADHYFSLDTPDDTYDVDWLAPGDGTWAGSVSIGSPVVTSGEDSTDFAGGRLDLGAKLRNWIDGKSQVSVSIWVKPDDWSDSLQHILDIMSQTNAEALRIYANADHVTAAISPSGTSATLIETAFIVSGIQSDPVHVGLTVDLTAREMQLFINGVANGSPSNWGPGDSAHNATFITGTPNSGYEDRIGHSIDLSGNAYAGLAGQFSFYSLILEESDFAAIYAQGTA